MKDISRDLPFVVCRFCVQAFDVDHWENRTRNTTKVSQTVDAKGDIIDIRIDAECPHCFQNALYSMERDYHWPPDEGDYEVAIAAKKLMVNEAENDALRRDRIELQDKITLLQRDLAQVKKERTRIRKEAKKMADIIHLAEKRATPRPERKEKEDRSPPYLR